MDEHINLFREINIKKISQPEIMFRKPAVDKLYYTPVRPPVMNGEIVTLEASPGR